MKDGIFRLTDEPKRRKILKLPKSNSHHKRKKQLEKMANALIGNKVGFINLQKKKVGLVHNT
jgi:hypothetical protein